jgi:hypothetical protein
MAELSIPVDAVQSDPSDYVFSFRVESIRATRAGVVDEPDIDDPIKGDAHALVRCSEPKPNKDRKREIRERIVADCRRVI